MRTVSAAASSRLPCAQSPEHSAATPRSSLRWPRQAGRQPEAMALQAADTGYIQDHQSQVHACRTKVLAAGARQFRNTFLKAMVCSGPCLVHACRKTALAAEAHHRFQTPLSRAMAGSGARLGRASSR